MGDEREEVAEELRRVQEEARGRARLDGGGPEPPPSAPRRERGGSSSEPPPAAEPPPPPPDAAAVNAAWMARTTPARGLRGLVHRLLDRVLRSRFEAQRTFNARQVQLDNEILRYLDERFAATHRHYDRILGAHGRRFDEVDERHALLEQELVSHVHDLVLTDANRGRLAQEFALEEIRARLARLEEAQRRRE